MSARGDVETAVRSVVVAGSASPVMPLALICVMAALPSACGRRVLMFTTGTVIGVEATAEEGIEQHLIVGVKRFEGAVVPTVPKGEAQPRDEAYSVFATLGFETGLLRPTRIVQVFGTGQAAMTLATSPDAMSGMASAARGRTLTYNVDPIATSLRKKIQARLDDGTPDPADPARSVGDKNWDALKTYLTGMGVTGGITMWLGNATAEELETAIRALNLE